MALNLKASALPDDSVEVGRVLDAWGVKGWLKILPHSSDPEALFSVKSWFLQPPDAKFRPGFNAFTGTVTITVDEAKIHSDSVVAKFDGLDDRNDAEALRGCRIFLPRSAFPKAAKDEYYWVDLIGLDVINREGVALGQVKELLSTSAQTVLVLEFELDGKTQERMIPFVAVYVDNVDLAGRIITVDWHPDY